MASHPITLTRKELYEKVGPQLVHTLATEYGSRSSRTSSSFTAPPSTMRPA